MSRRGKIAVSLLFLLLAVAAVLQGFAVVVMISWGMYDGKNVKQLKEEQIKRITAEYASIILREYAFHDWEDARRSVLADCENVNVNFVIYRGREIVDVIHNVSETDAFEMRYLAKDVLPDEYLREMVWSEGSMQYMERKVQDSDKVNVENYYVDCNVAEENFFADPIAKVRGMIDTAERIRYPLLGMFCITLFTAGLCFVLLVYNAGGKRGKENNTLCWRDRIPLDVELIAGAAIAAGVVLFADDAMGNISYLYAFCFADMVFVILLLVVSTVIISGLGLFIAETAFVRLRTKQWWKNTVIYKTIRLYGRGLLRAGRFLEENLPFLWKAVLGYAAVSAFELIGIAALSQYDTDAVLGFWIVEKVVLLGGFMVILLSMKTLQEGSERLAAGDLKYKIDTTYLLSEFKRHGENLNHISLGMQHAVEERMKSERFKTELITNVSHDIKTPLTSIINYVDLLGKEPLENQKAEEYVEVLRRQSARLKKLTEDLIEASKAASGAIEMELADCEVGVLLTQSAGEYEEKLKDAGLELRMSKPEEALKIYADGRHLWRVFDNLLSNILKYAQPGTRVYLSLEKKANQVEIIFRNTSQYPLSMTGEELQERFVRGDTSRSTEGSGLGLSIARSLTERMAGEFQIVTDGDLFKVILSFPLDGGKK